MNMYYVEIEFWSESNIAHFLYQSLSLLMDIINNTTNNIILLVPQHIISNFQTRWHSGILKILESNIDNFSLQIKDNSRHVNTYIIKPQCPSKINVNNLKKLREFTMKYYNISYPLNISYKILLTRIQDIGVSRRHVYGFEKVKDHFDLIIHSLNISFEEQVKLFSKCSHFVSVEGSSHFSNSIFMPSESKIMSICTRTDFSSLNDRTVNYDSWQLRFGGAELVKEFNVQTKATTRVACNTEQDHDMNDHIMIDDKLKEAIILFLA